MATSTARPSDFTRNSNASRPSSGVTKKLESLTLTRQPSQKANLVDDRRVFEFVRTKRSVVAWIERVLDLRPGQLGEDLHVSLRSGAVLCFVMLEIDPSSIPRVQDGQGLKEYKLRENMLFFLQAVRDYGVPAHLLFTANDIYNNTNIAAVVECLAVLAKLAESKGFRTPLVPLTADGDNSDAAIRKQLSAADMQQLKEQIARLKTSPGQVHRVKIAPAIMRLRMQLVVGKDFERLERGFTRLQAVFRGNRSRMASRKLVRDQAYRDKVAQEILTTEEHYVRDLKACIQAYLNPLREAISAKRKDFKNPDDMIKLFNDFEVIYQFNLKLLEQLRPVVRNWSSSQCVGKIFLGLMDFLKMYATYISLIDKVLAVLQDAAANKSSKLFKMLQELKDDPATRMLDLPSFLIMPVQRVPRYAMLLKDLTKHTAEGHPDYDALCQASKRAEEISAHLNERKRQAENMTVLLELQSSLQGKDAPRVVVEGRSLLRHGPFVDASRDKDMMLYVFSDIVLVCDSSSNKRETKELKHRETFELSGVNFVADAGRDTVLVITDMKTGKPLLSLKTGRKVERDKWVSDFQSLKPKADSASAADKLNDATKADVKGAESELLNKYAARTGRMSGAYRPLTDPAAAAAAFSAQDALRVGVATTTPSSETTKAPAAAAKATPPAPSSSEPVTVPASTRTPPSTAASSASAAAPASAKKLCGQCGEEVAAKFCVFCGTPSGWSPSTDANIVLLRSSAGGGESPKLPPPNPLSQSAQSVGSTGSAATDTSVESADDGSSDAKKEKKAEKLKREQEKAAEKLKKQQEKDLAKARDKDEKARKKDERKSKRISALIFSGDAIRSSQAGTDRRGSVSSDVSSSDDGSD